MRIGSIDYSSKATKLIAALMVCVLVFTLAIPAQPADAAAGVALAAGLTLAFVAACGVAFMVNEAQNSQSYWEGQIDSYLADSGLSDVGAWVDFGSVVYDTASGKLRYPGEVLSGLLDFFSWFTGKNSIEAGGSSSIIDSVAYWNGYSVYLEGYYYPSTFTFSSIGLNVFIPQLGENGFVLKTLTFPGYSYGSYQDYNCPDVGYSYVGSNFTTFSDVPLSYICSEIGLCLGATRSGSSYVITPALWGHPKSGEYSCVDCFAQDYSATSDLTFCEIDYNITAEGTLGMPDIGEKEEKLGYVPDVNIPLPETVAEDTNIGDINDAADAVLDYAGTAGNTLDLEYEYVEDTNVDTGTDTETGEGTGTDTETGTQTGSVALENVAADSLVEVAPETMLQDDTLMGLFISKFPWCIPFDLYFAISAFAADPVAPEFEVNLFEGVSWEGLDLSGTEMTLSFEAFEKVAAVTRWSTLIIFCAGLAMITKRMIWS